MPRTRNGLLESELGNLQARNKYLAEENIHLLDVIRILSSLLSTRPLSETQLK
jgi:hypothetical protein